MSQALRNEIARLQKRVDDLETALHVVMDRIQSLEQRKPGRPKKDETQ